MFPELVDQIGSLSTSPAADKVADKPEGLTILISYEAPPTKLEVAAAVFAVNWVEET